MARDRYVNRKGNEFAAEVGEWTLEMKDLTKAVWHESVIQFCWLMQRPVKEGGRMPVRTQFLRSSLMVSTSPVAVGTMIRPSDRGTYNYYPNRIEDAIRRAKVGETLYIGYGATYWEYLEYGHKGVGGYGFQRLAVQLWDYIVSLQVAMRSHS